MRFGISATYRCNQACPHCNRHLHLIPWSDSDLSPESVREAGDRANAKGIRIHKVRITGGEPTLNQNLREICEAVDSHWRPERQSVVLTNGTLPKPNLSGLRFRYGWGTDKKKAEIHRPWMISPVDLGLEPKMGFNRKECWVQKGCGRGFDAYGFSCCVFAGALGRLFGIDPYSPQPVEFGTEELCRHCICSLSRRDQWRLWTDAMDGRLETPTKEYAEALDRIGREGVVRFKRFEER